METFTQTWGNTSCGFEGFGGDAISSQRTYVFIPVTADENCFVYFGGRFGYEVSYSQDFIKDVYDRNIAGVKHKNKYLIK